MSAPPPKRMMAGDAPVGIAGFRQSSDRVGRRGGGSSVQRKGNPWVDRHESARVRGFLGRVGVSGLVDVHTHFMPERVLAKVWAYFDAVGPLTGMEWPISYRHEEDERVALLREFGVRAFTSMLYPHKPGMARWLNGWAAEFAARTPDCLSTATFFPEDGVEAYVREAVEGGARVFKAHLQVGAYDPNDERLDRVWGLLAEARVPVVVHCGSGPVPGKHTGPGPVGRLLARHPRLPLVVAHLGMPEYTDFLDLAERYEEVRLDTTMAFTDFSERFAPFPRVARGRLADLGDRILLGSDFPNIPYPYLHQLEALERLELGNDWLRAVCYENGARLFALEVG
ncbi:amidohydrolase [Streptomyces sp. GMY02]|uniref:amidohydrolase family protein n=1 Tax=Streptomyces sp. GMY02 TaxID=1333528 RepID=UPI001C2BFA43|nr:amidohydrolase family protein [Streptomyces sp. GMY02]QXE35964.1 amidohydrolase [Streptomyces sp. GMY02]